MTIFRDVSTSDSFTVSSGGSSTSWGCARRESATAAVAPSAPRMAASRRRRGNRLRGFAGYGAESVRRGGVGPTRDVSTGSALTTSMQTTGVFPNMVLQMSSIGEEAGSLDHMLAKAAEFYEDEVDDMVKGLSSLMEPFIIVILGVLIGGIVVAMYLPIFKLGAVV